MTPPSQNGALRPISEAYWVPSGGPIPWANTGLEPPAVTRMARLPLSGRRPIWRLNSRSRYLNIVVDAKERRTNG
jgi:hypothetical protein